MEEKLTAKTAFGYSVAGIAEASMYQFVNGFSLLFLTSVVGLEMGMAGMITSIGMLMETVGGLVVGKISDSCTSSKGRRRPFIFMMSIYVPAIIVLLFTNFGGIESNLVKGLIYGTAVALFWTGHSMMYVPFTAFGAELATNYDDRTKLKSLSSGFGVLGCLFGSAVPMFLVGALTKMGFLEAKAWFLVAIFVGGINFLSMFTCWKLTAGMEKVDPNGRFDLKKSFRELPLLFVDFWELLKLKSMRILICFKIVFNTGYAFFTSTMVFFLQYRLGYGNEVTSSIYSIQIIVNFATVFLVSFIALRIGRSRTLLSTLGIGGIGCLLFYLIGIHGYVQLIIFIIMFSAASNSFWQLSSAIFYDITEVDELVYGKRREGAITALQSSVGGLFSSLVVGGFGMYLKFIGFDATIAQQSQMALHALDQLFMLVPGACFILACAILMLYPLSKKRFESLQQVLRLRAKGEDYSRYQEDLDKIL